MSNAVPVVLGAICGFLGLVFTGQRISEILGPIYPEIAIGAATQILFAFCLGFFGVGRLPFFWVGVVQRIAFFVLGIGIGQLLCFPLVGFISVFSGAWSIGISVGFFTGARSKNSKVPEEFKGARNQ